MIASVFKLNKAETPCHDSLEYGHLLPAVINFGNGVRRIVCQGLGINGKKYSEG